MKSYPNSAEVFADIGEKPVGAFATSVQRTRQDLAKYRSTFPLWVSDHGERGLANWISDRLWAHLLSLADSISDMSVVEKGPLREVLIGVNYRFRVKRHDEEGNIASYETPSFLDFVLQEPSEAKLPGLEETRLVAGYEWNKELRDIGAAVISLRDGKENVIWKEQLPEPADESTGLGHVVTPEQAGPTAPIIDLPREIGEATEERPEDQ